MLVAEQEDEEEEDMKDLVGEMDLPTSSAVLAALSNADVIDVSGVEPIFDLLDANGDVGA